MQSETRIHIPPITITEHSDLYGPPGSKRVVAMCGSCYGVEHWTQHEGPSIFTRASFRAARSAVLLWLQEREESIVS